MSNQKLRLDVLLVERGLTPTRERAQALILAGDVRVGGAVAHRSSALVEPLAEISVERQPQFVSRGGTKLAHALDSFGIYVQGLTVVDVGASTGGFTDALLQRGCTRVYAVDVGYGQLAWSIRQDPRVIVLERTNIRYVESLPELVHGAVVDASFISLTLILPSITRLVEPSGWIVALVKPQFEAGRSQVGKGGVVRDRKVHRDVLTHVLAFARTIGLRAGGCVPSPILGPAGNREFLVLLRLTGPSLEVDGVVDQCLNDPAVV